MKLLPTYRILTYILLPILTLIGVSDLSLLMAAFSNPPLLMAVFISLTTVVYMWCCFFFVKKGIEEKRKVKPSLKDWIKVNAFVGIVFCLIVFFTAGVALTSPSLLKMVAEQMQDIYKSQGLTTIQLAEIAESLRNMFIAALIFFGVFFVHIILTFIFLKKHADVFTAPAA